ncbi:MAG TPA: exopolyphosphatase [Niabella sp.]|nr:exopolyphosphatase [Niabella sp.]HOZ97028.1 exopolyphosphatase [Niabella sp.]HQW15018.1 exopolyphosphatase [Niabella sp.]HQX20090.1 exopolyphosphatase [Niabella sp.]HQX40398.1 exopolyphosphatase [Niabella sp.]
MKLAAIDIGSNAVRLLITDVFLNAGRKPEFIKSNLIRVPLRLGFDVFETGEISKEKENSLLETIKAYKHLLNAYEVTHLRACATSAMRDAKNSKAIIERIRKTTNVEIEIISGDLEASLIYETHIAEGLEKDVLYIYADVGGGSTELTFYLNNKLLHKQSFDIGTIRILKQKVVEAHWEEMKNVIRTQTKDIKKVMAIGSGGNINKIFSLSKKKEGKPLTLALLRDYYKELSNLSLTERMSLFNMREDRADVIVPALLIYINVLKWANTEEILVPKIGLADGLIHSMYEALVEKQTLSTKN